MGGSHAKAAPLPTPTKVTMEDIGAHILNADPELKDVPWSQKQLYSQRALEHAKTQHLQGGTNRVIEPFWEKLELKPKPAVPSPPASTVSRKRSELFLKSINEPKVHQPTRSELGLTSSPQSSISGGNNDTSSEEDSDYDE